MLKPQETVHWVWNMQKIIPLTDHQKGNSCVLGSLSGVNAYFARAKNPPELVHCTDDFSVR